MLGQPDSLIVTTGEGQPVMADGHALLPGEPTYLPATGEGQPAMGTFPRDDPMPAIGDAGPSMETVNDWDVYSRKTES